MSGIDEGFDESGIVHKIRSHDKLGFLQANPEEETEYGKDFSQDTRSKTFIQAAIHGAVKCEVCGGRIHKNSMSFDHIVRREDGGQGNPGNAQLTHPYCNTGYKESLVAKAKKQQTGN